MLYLGTFGLQTEKAVVISEISTFKFLKDESLTHTVNFGVGLAFSKGPASSFSEDPGVLFNIKFLTQIPKIIFD